MPRNEKSKHGGYYSTKGFHYKTPCSNIPYIQTDSGPTFVTVIIFFSFVRDFTVMINFPNTFAYFRFEKSWCEITV